MSPRPQLSADEVAARRTAILAAAIDEIVRRGPENVRMKDVAAGAGVSVGTVQYYFATRDELLVQAFSTHSRGVIEAIERLSQVPGSAWERLQATLRAVPAVGSHERRSIVWVELVASARRQTVLEDALAEVFDRWRAHLRTLIDAGVADGSFLPRIEEETIVDTLIAQIDGCDLAVAAGRPARQISDGLEATAAALLGIGADSRSAASARSTASANCAS